MQQKYYPTLREISKAKLTLGEIISPTPLLENRELSSRYSAKVFLKREDLQIVRSYKIRGAYNKIKSLDSDQLKNGVVCASAGNHAQGVAFSCNHLGIKGHIYMPTTTPKQKIEQVKMFGNGQIEIVLTGDTFDTSNKLAMKFAKENIIIVERESAIRFAVSEAREGDVLILAGKGHEKYEIGRDGRVPFDEIEILRDAVLKRKI